MTKELKITMMILFITVYFLGVVGISREVPEPYPLIMFIPGILLLVLWFFLLMEY